jgi:ankyrin repeat protein
MYCFDRLSRSPVLRFAAVLPFVLAWGSIAFGQAYEINNAAVRGDWDEVNLLLKRDPKLVSNIGPMGKTPLHEAAENGHKAVVALLLANKADIEAKDDEHQTPLGAAAALGKKDIVELLLAHGANVNGNHILDTPLHVAAINGHEDVVELLLADKAHYETIFDSAAVGDLEKVKVLLKENPDLVSNKGEGGLTPLHCAGIGGHKDVAE